jgi:hypothetical protein
MAQEAAEALNKFRESNNRQMAETIDIQGVESAED